MLPNFKYLQINVLFFESCSNLTSLSTTGINLFLLNILKIILTGCVLDLLMKNHGESSRG